MPQNDGGVFCTDGPGRLNVLHIPHREHRAADYPREQGDRGDPQGDDEVDRAGPQRGYDHNGEHGHRNGHDDIHKAHDHIVNDSAEITRHRTQQPACQQGQRDGAGGHCQGQAAAMDHPRQHIPAKLIRSKGMLPAGRQQLGDIVGLHHGLIVKQQIGAEGQQEQDGQDHDPDHSAPVPGQTAEGLFHLAVFLEFQSRVLFFHQIPPPYLYMDRTRGSTKP